jgi:hypothetical protein
MSKKTNKKITYNDIESLREKIRDYNLDLEHMESEYLSQNGWTKTAGIDLLYKYAILETRTARISYCKKDAIKCQAIIDAEKKDKNE